MQTERVTFLTSRDHKAALDAFATRNGMSVGHVAREATSNYISKRNDEADEHERALELIVPELEAAMAKWNLRLDSMEASLDAAHEAVREALADVERTSR